MSYVRSSGYRLKDPDDDAALQCVIGDLQRIALDLKRGSFNSAYMLKPEVAKALFDSSGQAPGEAGSPLSVNMGGTGSSGGSSSVTSIFNVSGIPVGGTALVTSLYTSGTGTHTFHVGARFALFRLIGGGGQGGGTPGAADMYGGGGGQGATVWGCIRISGFSNMVYTIGAGGTGGTSGSSGGDGAASTLVVNGSTITANPGLGGTAGGTSFVSDAYGQGGTSGSAEFLIGSFYSTWGTSGVMGQPGGYSRRGKGGQTSPIAFGNGSTGGAQGNAAGAGTAGHLVVYDI